MRKLSAISALFAIILFCPVSMAGESPHASFSPVVKKVLPSVVKIEVFKMAASNSERSGLQLQLPPDSMLHKFFEKKKPAAPV